MGTTISRPFLHAVESSLLTVAYIVDTVVRFADRFLTAILQTCLGSTLFPPAGDKTGSHDPDSLHNSNDETIEKRPLWLSASGQRTQARPLWSIRRKDDRLERRKRRAEWAASGLDPDKMERIVQEKRASKQWTKGAQVMYGKPHPPLKSRAQTRDVTQPDGNQMSRQEKHCSIRLVQTLSDHGTLDSQDLCDQSNEPLSDSLPFELETPQGQSCGHPTIQASTLPARINLKKEGPESHQALLDEEPGKAHHIPCKTWNGAITSRSAVMKDGFENRFAADAASTDTSTLSKPIARKPMSHGSVDTNLRLLAKPQQVRKPTSPIARPRSQRLCESPQQETSSSSHRNASSLDLARTQSTMSNGRARCPDRAATLPRLMYEDAAAASTRLGSAIARSVTQPFLFAGNSVSRAGSPSSEASRSKGPSPSPAASRPPTPGNAGPAASASCSILPLPQLRVTEMVDLACKSRWEANARERKAWKGELNRIARHKLEQRQQAASLASTPRASLQIDT